MPADPVDGVVLANELLDNLPFGLAVNDGGWRQAYVTDRGDGTFAEVLPMPFGPAERLPARAAHGARVPIQEAAGAWLAAARSIVGRGRVVVVDYARTTTAELAAAPWRSWLRTYRGHERGGSYLAGPGDQDITADVALDQLPDPTPPAARRSSSDGSDRRPRRGGPGGVARPRRSRPAGDGHAQPGAARPRPSRSAGLGGSRRWSGRVVA